MIDNRILGQENTELPVAAAGRWSLTSRSSDRGPAMAKHVTTAKRMQATQLRSDKGTSPMISLVSGIALIGAAIALLYPFIPGAGVESNRSDWIDICIAIAVSASLAMGVGLIIIGLASF
jgi:hypothetical protein